VNKGRRRRVTPPTWRRQLNETFTGPDGAFNWSKAIAVPAQVIMLNWLWIGFDRLLDKPETLLIILSFLIAPDIVRKAMYLKMGGSTK
jgi:hypothetical protein